MSTVLVSTYSLAYSPKLQWGERERGQGSAADATKTYTIKVLAKKTFGTSN